VGTAREPSTDARTAAGVPSTPSTRRRAARGKPSGKTRQEVAVKLAKALSDREGGLAFDAVDLKIGEYLERWLNDSVRNSVKQRTFENYSYVVRSHLIPAVGHMKVKTLTPTHVQGLYRSKLDAGLSPRTVQLIHTTLHKALKQAVRWGLVHRNATEGVEAPRPAKNPRKEMHPLSPGQARNLLEAARGERLEALYVLAITAGLRQGELFGLRWQDVDLENGTLSVRQQLVRTKGDGLQFATPKSAKGRRSVRLTSKAVQALKDHHEEQLEQKQRLAGLWKDTGLVFTSSVGTPLDPSNFTYHTFQPFLKRAELPKIRFHDLRHTCATLLLGRNVNPKIVQEMLGHANISETMDTYSHVLPAMQETAVSAIEDALS
jgi:integrase